MHAATGAALGRRKFSHVSTGKSQFGLVLQMLGPASAEKIRGLKHGNWPFLKRPPGSRSGRPWNGRRNRKIRGCPPEGGWAWGMPDSRIPTPRSFALSAAAGPAPSRRRREGPLHAEPLASAEDGPFLFLREDSRRSVSRGSAGRAENSESSPPRQESPDVRLEEPVFRCSGRHPRVRGGWLWKASWEKCGRDTAMDALIQRGGLLCCALEKRRGMPRASPGGWEITPDMSARRRSRLIHTVPAASGGESRGPRNCMRLAFQGRKSPEGRLHLAFGFALERVRPFQLGLSRANHLAPGTEVLATKFPTLFRSRTSSLDSPRAIPR